MIRSACFKNLLQNVLNSKLELTNVSQPQVLMNFPVQLTAKLGPSSTDFNTVGLSLVLNSPEGLLLLCMTKNHDLFVKNRSLFFRVIFSNKLFQ